MPGVIAGNPPGIHTPGIGPNGPGPIDARLPETSVGFKSSVPYADSLGFATTGGVTGYQGPAASSLQTPLAWYVRIGGSNNNGGSSNSLTPERTGTDGVGAGGTTFTSATASFTQADVNKGICVNVGSLARRYRIISVTNSTTVILDHATQNSASLPWAIGGAWADPRAAWADNAVTTDSIGHIRAGDTVYIGAGTYRFASILGTGWNIAYNGVVTFQGDVTGAFTGDAGMVCLTNYVTSDKVAPSANVCINLIGRTNIAFKNIFIVGGMSGGSNLNTQNFYMTDCAIMASGNAGGIFGFNIGSSSGSVASQVKGNIHIDRSFFFGGGGNPSVSIGAFTNLDLNIWITNCMFLLGSGNGLGINVTSSSGGTGNGVRLRNCTYQGSSTFFKMASAASSILFPSTMYNCLAITGNGSQAASASATGQVIEDYNVFIGSSPRNLVTAGAHSISDGSYAPMFHFGQEVIWGGLPRPVMEQMASSPLLGFGTVDAGTSSPYDIMNRPRPAGSGSPLPAVGAFERGNTAVQGTSPAPTSGANNWQFTGPGYQDFLLPVSAVASGFSIQVQRDTNYSPATGGSLPAIILNPDVALAGIATQKIVDTGAAGSWNTLTFASFTPTQVGWVKIRIVSYDGTGTSVVSFAVAAPTP